LSSWKVGIVPESLSKHEDVWNDLTYEDYLSSIGPSL
jgi:hypothetical protein